MDDKCSFSTNVHGNISNYSKSCADGVIIGNDMQLPYTIPGILHFLQTEWGRFEMERSQWDVERAELQARIAFLQGERKGQENLKQDLVRRIKMLEFALKQERAKFHRLKYGSDVSSADHVSKVELVSAADLYFTNAKNDLVDGLSQGIAQATSASNAKWKQGRQILRQYLQDIGYTDTILDVRQARVKQLMGVNPEDTIDKSHLLNGEDSKFVRRARQSADENLSDLERSLIDNLPFFQGSEEDISDEDEVSQKEEELLADDEEDALAEFDFLVSQQGNDNNSVSSNREISDISDSSGNADQWSIDESALSKLKEKYRQERGKNGLAASSRAVSQRPKRSTLVTMLASLGPEEELPSVSDNVAIGISNSAVGNCGSGSATSLGSSSEMNITDPDLIENSQVAGYNAALGLGDLATITVANEAEVSYNTDGSVKENFRKTWSSKYTLRSHFDGVRTVAFHPLDAVLLTGSEDHTLKLWNLNKTIKGTKSFDVEPVYTFRGHTGPVLSLAIHPVNGEQAFSGGLDGQIRIWNLPSSLLDPYDSFDVSVMGPVLEGHTDAVWSLAMHASRPNQLLSASADGTVRLWLPYEPLHQLHQTIHLADPTVKPTSVCFCSLDPNHMVVGTTSGSIHLMDINSGMHFLKFKQPDGNNCQVNRVISHPTQPITIAAHEDHTIRFYDNSTGQVTHSMKAHLDAVTSLATDPNGLYLLSASHDCSIRLWNLDSKTCVQEITSHRKKFDESINDVAFHPSKPYLASAGADALAKVFV